MLLVPTTTTASLGYEKGSLVSPIASKLFNPVLTGDRSHIEDIEVLAPDEQVSKPISA